MGSAVRNFKARLPAQSLTKERLTMSNQTEEQIGATSTKRRIRVGIVGCGEVTQIMHWPSLYQLVDRFEVTALCDVSPLILEELGKLWNVRTLTTNHRELVARNDVDAILVANPNAFHAEVTLDAYRGWETRACRKANMRHPP